MKGTIEIARIANIPLKIHWSFAILLPLIIYWGRSQGADWEGVTVLLGLVLALFVCVVLHEFGHALSAKYYNVRTHEIIILPLGGAAMLDRLPEKPLEELIIAIAGPAVNALIALLLWLFIKVGFPHQYYLLGDMMTPSVVYNSAINFCWVLCQINIALVVLNLIPAFPLDGGRVLRALLSTIIPRDNATNIAAWLGKIFAVVACLLGIYWSDPATVLVALVIFYGANNEQQSIGLVQKLKQYSVKDIMNTQFTILEADTTIQSAWELLRKNRESAFIVMQDTECIGVLEESGIMAALKKQQSSDSVRNWIKPQIASITDDASIMAAQTTLQQNSDCLLAVYNTQHELIAVVDEDTVHNFLRLVKDL